jgi:DNA-binding transcriptional MerR regulator
MQYETLQVGELAKRTSLTIRTLHHYDEIGLLKPSMHTEAGYRLYTAADVARLQQVLSLRQLGFSLDEVRACLNHPDFAPLEVIRMHVARLREQIDLQRRLCDRLEAIAGAFQSVEEVSADAFLQTIEVMTMLENYFTPEQHELFNRRREQAGEDATRQMQEEWARLIADVRGHMDAGTDPNEAEVQVLAKRWMSMVHESTGGDQAIKESLKRLWEEQGDVLAAQHGAQYDPRPVFGYITQAIATAKQAT